jgi:hypothetical protein
MARTVITLKGDPFISEEGQCTEAITPGHLVAGVTSITKHATANGPGRTYALERDELGKEISVAYASGDTVKVGSFTPGSRVYAFVASGQTITAGSYLGSAGDGTLKAWASGPYLARALEAVTATALTRIRVEVY